MAETQRRDRAVRAAVAGMLLRLRARHPRLRGHQESARLALTEVGIRRLDDRIDVLLDVLAQMCDYSGQADAAGEFRSLSSQPQAAASEPVLRLVRGQQ